MPRQRAPPTRLPARSPFGASFVGGMYASEFTYADPGWKTPSGLNAGPEASRVQAIAVVSRDAERMRSFKGALSARTCDGCVQ